MHIWSPRQHLIDNVIDLVGIKSGLAISESKAFAFLDELSPGWWIGEKSEVIRIDMLDFEEAFIHLMYKVGALNDDEDLCGVVVRYVNNNLNLFNIAETDIMEKIEIVSMLQHHLVKNALDKEALPKEFSTLPGIENLAKEFKDRYVLPLDDLFDKESIPNASSPDCYLDQRYIDYLSSQTDELGDIHWRQFEYLTGEYFKRHGYEVEVTVGRRDGGIDVVAKKHDPITGPEMILVQCKKYSENNPVEVDSIRAFWATVDDSGATKGIIATTSRLTSGAKDYCKAKMYRLDSADNTNIKGWLQSMKTSHNNALQRTSR
jgi:restriction system protein